MPVAAIYIVISRCKQRCGYETRASPKAGQAITDRPAIMMAVYQNHTSYQASPWKTRRYNRVERPPQVKNPYLMQHSSGVLKSEWDEDVSFVVRHIHVVLWNTRHRNYGYACLCIEDRSSFRLSCKTTERRAYLWRCSSVSMKLGCSCRNLYAGAASEFHWNGLVLIKC